MPTTTSTCLIGSKSTASSGRDSVPVPDGEIAAMEIGAAIGATACQTTQDDNLITKGKMGKKSNGTATSLYVTAPHFFRARALGLTVKDYQNLILVKENGLRFFDENAPTRDYEYYAAALAWTGDPRKMN